MSDVRTYCRNRITHWEIAGGGQLLFFSCNTGHSIWFWLQFLPNILSQGKERSYFYNPLSWVLDNPKNVFHNHCQAGDCGHLGYRSNLSPGRGSLYLLTREDEPFCGKLITMLGWSWIMCHVSAAQFKIKMMFTGSRLPIHTYGALQIKLINKEGINETFTLTRY